MKKTLVLPRCLVKFGGLERDFLMQAVYIDVLVASLKDLNLLFQLRILNIDGLGLLDRPEVGQEMVEALLHLAELDALPLGFVDDRLVVKGELSCTVFGGVEMRLELPAVLHKGLLHHL